MGKCNIALYGCGTVGGAVARFLLDNCEETSRRTGYDINLSYIIDKRIDELKKQPMLRDIRLSDNIQEPMEDPEVDIVVELIGGIDTAGEIVEKALKSGKNVVTANKALLAARGGELFQLARQCERSIAFEASVGGGIPIISALCDTFVPQPIESIHGIVNGTCNYILTRMTLEGVSYEEALEAAQARGYAEADPTLDVEGGDSAHKLAILARLSFGLNVNEKDIYCEGISRISPADLDYAGSLGYKLKLLATGRLKGEGVELHVNPALLPLNHPLASVNNSVNAVCVHGSSVGEVTLTGLGAGAEPTSSAVVGDICKIARGAYQREFQLLPALSKGKQAKVLKQSNLKTKYYFRLACLDKAGVLASVSGVLGRHNISVSSCIQQEESLESGHVPVVFMTHKVKEKNMLDALSEINELKYINGDETSMLRVADI